MMYFSLAINQSESGHWFLKVQRKNPATDLWLFSRGEFYTGDDVDAVIQKAGRALDINVCTFGIVIVSERCSEILAKYCATDIQLVPVRIAEVPGNWFILNALRIVDCLDYSRSIIDFYPSQHDRLPGKPRGIRKLVIDTSRTNRHNVFRIKDWPVPVIVSSALADAFKSANISGFDCYQIDI